MKSEKVHTLILGAGPSGLAAGYGLSKAGLHPVVLEKDHVSGGLMRSISRGEFVVDVGRKELYNRLEKVDALWSEVLGKDYRSYQHRGGILYQNHIIDMSPAYQGFRRGMPWGMFLGCATDFLKARLLSGSAKPTTLEEYFYKKRGRGMTRVFSQGFQEKLTGKRWSEVKLPEQSENEDDASFISTLKALLERTFSKKEVNTYKGIWRHPAKGTGQICQRLADGITSGGGRIVCDARLVEMTASADRVESVTAEVGGDKTVFEATHVVSSIPLEALIKFLLPERSTVLQTRSQALDPQRRTVVLVYLFLNEEPQFPHAWLQVTDPRTRIGRITNYTAFNGEMVPKGKTCLCCEYYCFGPDVLLDTDPKQLVKMTLEACAESKLIHPEKCFDHIVLKLPGADASQNRDNWMSKARVELLSELGRFKNLYYVNRTELDIATLAGTEAAEAIISGKRADFDRRVDPAELQIRSEGKAFEFKNPAAA